MVPNNVKPNHPSSIWASKALREINKNALVRSPKHIISQTAGGTFIKEKAYQQVATYAWGPISKWDKNEFYDVGNTVYVDSTNWLTSSYNATSMVMGTYLCTTLVPSNNFPGTSSAPYGRESASFYYYPRWSETPASRSVYWTLIGAWPQAMPVCTGSAPTDVKTYYIAGTAMSGSTTY